MSQGCYDENKGHANKEPMMKKIFVKK